ncbi:hypothetical protein GCM10010234_67000 [Streptomyces hawaiiensis]
MFGSVTVGAMGLRSSSKSAAPPAGEAAECVDEAARQSSRRPGRIGPPSRIHPIGGCSEKESMGSFSVCRSSVRTAAAIDVMRFGLHRDLRVSQTEPWLA